jgi:hypothetical protein
MKVSGSTSLVWPLILKAALPGNGRIGFFKDAGPARHLRKILGGRPESEGRFYQTAIDELCRAKLISLEDEAIVVTEWVEFLPRRCPTDDLDTRRWVRLFGFESPSFRRLPPLVRGFAHWLLREVRDEEGTLIVEVDFLLDRLGWLYGDDYRHLRQAGYVPSWLSILKADGYLEEHESDPGLARIRNFKTMQPALPADRVEVVVSPGSARGEVVVSPGSARGELVPKLSESLSSHPQEGREGRKEDQIPPTPRAAGGGQAELFRAGEPGPDRRGAGAKPDRRKRQRRMPPPVPRPAAGYPAAFETAFAPYPNHRGLKPQAHACWLALAAELGEAKLLERVTAHLGWKVGSHWADGIGVPAFERYLHQRWFDEDRPANPEAERPPARGAPRDFEAERRKAAEEGRQRSIAAAAERRRAAIAAEAAEAAKAVPPLEAARLRALDWTDFRRDRNCGGLGYHRPSDPAIDAVVDRVLLARIAEFRQAHPGEPLPKIMREFLVAKPEHAERAAPRPAPAPAPPRRPYIPAGTWPPKFTEPASNGQRTAASASLRLVSERGLDVSASQQLQARLQDAAARLARLEQAAAQHQQHAGSG